MQQNNILKVPVSSLGYGFIPANQIPKGKDEYYLRNIQNRSGIDYRQLSAFEIEVLVRNRNTSDNWNNILVSDAFNPELVKNCKFYGLVRIGKLEAFYLSFSDLKVPVGLYNSTIISCDLGDNVVVDNVNYLSHYIIGNEVILNNINELVATNHTKFGNGILKTGESEAVRIWMEICNENTGRKVIPFNGMLAGDAYIWSKYKDDALLQQKLIEITEAQFDTKRGYYGKIGDRTVIKNCSILKDCWIGSDAYIKGANKLKNLTINSGEEGKTQIGEGCEMVNGIIGFGCRAFYGVKAVRFVMASHSQLKYGARLINSYLGNNATISCCEVLNSLIFPAHEQHHNNSFLCAATIMGQSNIAAGATIGSNHNSRGNDGELIAGRGFWPGLCVSLKHNSVFASFTMIAKGDYMNELQIPIPFSLISNDASKDQLTVMPAFWFQYNMYALERNAWKYVDRDKRIERKQLIEYDYLAPDTIEEIIHAMQLLELFTGRAFLLKEEPGKKPDLKKAAALGKQLLMSQDAVIDSLAIYADGFENSRRKVQLVKVRNAYDIFRQLITYFGANALMQSWRDSGIKSFRSWQESLPTKLKRQQWMNVGGQLMTTNELSKLKEQIKKGKLKNWYAVHDQYELIGQQYEAQKNHYGLAVLEEITGLNIRSAAAHNIVQLLQQAVATKEWMCKGIYDSRAKDYSNSFRKMVYDTVAEMNAVLGKLEQNSFIKEQEIQLKQYKQEVDQFIKQLGKK